ncbi:hypothetical protein ACJZ2D_012470 [Fusarium nematophilum]
MATRRQETTTGAASSPSRPQASPHNAQTARRRRKRRGERVDPVTASTPRRPDEIEEAESEVPAATRSPRRTKSPDEQGEDDDSAESVYLSDDDEDDEDEDEEETTSDVDSSDSDDSVESSSPRHLTRRSTGGTAKHPSTSPRAVVQTRTESTHWTTTQHPRGNELQPASQNGMVSRGTRTVHQQTTVQGSNIHTAATQERRSSNGNSLRFNMSVNVDMSFSGLVTGRNLSFAGGQLSYSWNRRS